MKNLSVLVLEDHPFQRLMVVTALRSAIAGRIYEASEGGEALAVLKACGGVDIAICDLQMAGKDGLEFLREAGNARLVHSVILNSALDPALCQASAAMIECLGLAFLGELARPLDVSGLAALLAKFQRSRRRADSALVEPPPVNEVRQGLDRGEFKAYYQPKVSINGESLVEAEVLARWHHPQHGVLSPAHFLPAMQTHGLMETLFWRMLDQGLELQEQQKRTHPPASLAFNLHPSQLASPHLTDGIDRALARRELSASDITLEITEDGLESTPAAILENLVRLRVMGCGLAMDDFGAGYSSLDRLCAFPFSQIKLDASFVRRLKIQPRTAAVIRGVASMAEALGLAMVVEGVETLEQRKQLQQLGCKIAQGYLYARPMDQTQFLGYCQTHRPGTLH
ncbi:EAL domain-containing protein [Achromobacter sp. UMC46]|uniref:EAL domain-containing response regulator n=1 Tax=Achromobacter sp. UMC46 TaxID=1862319 RepID=UPI0015FF6663|nr:EAL domain-containing response regulator [Achromobacter sp. UMC46]MBB1595786.1 diguanylate phosphodiesterase [Achromobacter sp. UMC46]